MPTTTKSHSTLRRLFRFLRNRRSCVDNRRLWDSFGRRAWPFAGAVLLLTANGCIATRGWVRDQVNPIAGRLNDTDAKADRALAGLQNLHLEKRLVLDSSKPTFAFGSAALGENAKHEIDGFFEDLQGSPNAESASGRVIVVAGYTDSVGGEDYNYELGQRRAERVAGYIVGKEGVDPTQLRVVSYGAGKPIADNGTSSGRRSNRRVEILVYQEKIATGSAQRIPESRIVRSDAGS
jgi:outer membrane protein OmpA-like peptidoglycan-associated protein